MIIFCRVTLKFGLFTLLVSFALFYIKKVSISQKGTFREAMNTLQSCQVVFELFSILIPKNQYFAEEISIFPRGNNMTKKKYIFTSHASGRSSFFPRGSIVHEPRSGEPIFFAILNPRK